MELQPQIAVAVLNVNGVSKVLGRNGEDGSTGN